MKARGSSAAVRIPPTHPRSLEITQHKKMLKMKVAPNELLKTKGKNKCSSELYLKTRELTFFPYELMKGKGLDEISGAGLGGGGPWMRCQWPRLARLAWSSADDYTAAGADMPFHVCGSDVATWEERRLPQWPACFPPMPPPAENCGESTSTVHASWVLRRCSSESAARGRNFPSPRPGSGGTFPR